MDSDLRNKQRAERRQKLLAILGDKCQMCGSTENLQFDHLNRKNKKFNIGHDLNKAEDELIKEVKKCQLLCQDCHRKKTHDNWEYALPPAEHGTLWMYKSKKCRCTKCQKAMSDYYYARKGR